MPSRQRSVERPQTCASSPGRDAVTRTSESNGSADCAAARGGDRSRWNRTWQSPGEILLHRLHYAHSSLGMVANCGRGRCHISRATPREALLEKLVPEPLTTLYHLRLSSSTESPHCG